MEKSCGERDLDDWEVLPDNKSLMDFSHGSQNDVLLKELKLDANYFICPSQSFLEQQQNSEPAMGKKKSDDDDEAKGFKDIGVVTPDVESQRMKEVVQQAARLNQALSAVRGAPMTRAHISFGGSIASA
ncbi:hypothetical protein B296_00011228 [Ensete ventricosum]|uniref:DUF6821 domain-containing protein n=1 Tax=Ensete ventricosum TaxID=4639 RepID=A0A427A374_ENSVE|nr:hypothetical protein B296_00011228 [Ensete ventricosum]